MKVLNNILKMEMSNIHLLKPSKNVRMKELFLWFFIFGIMVLYGGILLTQIKKTQIIENSLFYVYGLSLVAAIYDYGINIKRVLYDYEQYVLISYLPVKTFYIVLAKLMTTVVMTLRWNIVVGFSYTIVYVFQRNLPATYIILGLLLLIFASFLISVFGSLLEFLFQKSKWFGIFGILVEVIITGLVGYGIACSSQKGFYNICDVFFLIIMIAVEMTLLLIIAYKISCNYGDTLRNLEWKRESNRNKYLKLTGVTSSKALYRKEKAAFYSSKVYAMNSLAPIIIFSILLMIFCVIPKELMHEYLTKTGYMNEINGVLPLLICFVFGVANPTYCSISIEGKCLDVLKSKPIRFKKILHSKIKVFLVCSLPFAIIDSIGSVYAIGKEIDIIKMISVFLCLITFIIVMGNVGILLDLLLGSTEWENPITVIKQSITMPLQMLCASVLLCIPMECVFLHLLSNQVLYFMTVLYLMLIEVYVYNITKKVAMKKLGL